MISKSQNKIKSEINSYKYYNKSNINDYITINSYLMKSKDNLRNNTFKNISLKERKSNITFKNELLHSKIYKNFSNNNSRLISKALNSKKNLLRVKSCKLNKKHKNDLKIFNNKYSARLSRNTNHEKQKELSIKNTISYIDRNKIKKLNSMSLKIYETYLRKKNQPLINGINYMEQDDILNQNNNEYILNNLNSIDIDNKNVIKGDNDKNNSRENSEQSNNQLSNYKNKIKKTLKKFKTERKYCLKQLVEFNPYHLVSDMVRYCNTVEMKNISEKLSRVNGASFNKKATTKLLFFKNENITNKRRISKVIHGTSVSLNKNLSLKGGLVWRILARITKLSGYNSFYIACKFKGYSELWKHYSLLIEQLLAKYSEIKWFLEKNKYMKKEVFVEFLTLMKLVPKNDNTFPNKIFLLFDEESTGEINFKLFLFIMELTSKTSSDIEKIIFYVELFSDLKLKDKNSCVNVFEMYEILKHLINSSNHTKEYKFLYDLLKNEFNDGEKISINLYINKQQLCQFFLNNKYIQKLLQNFWFQYKFADIVYNEEINSSFNSTVKNVKKFLNQQNEVTKLSLNECSNLENILKAIKDKEKAEIGIKNLNNELNNISIQNEDNNNDRNNFFSLNIYK